MQKVHPIFFKKGAKPIEFTAKKGQEVADDHNLRSTTIKVE